MKVYLVKTIYRNIYGEICSTYLSKEYRTIGIAKRYMDPRKEQVLVERDIRFINHTKKVFHDTELEETQQ